MEDYTELLRKVREKLPESSTLRERFEVPKVLGHIQGNRTIVSNFPQIAHALGRESPHMLKFILKELATPGELKRTGLLFGAKIPASRINEKIRLYADRFVLCTECGKPDTKLEREGPITRLKCAACGAKNPVKEI
ncbi:MAG TPA: translation initiation factor IF-2 subunit beta [Candidatus Nanoarchaeia archaeon]|nr:translation initiation factor IF-2 subunit beta [Candidatus Nanoarchaeia archaeon]